MGLTSIEWTDYTFNPWVGCMKVSEGCKNCYAETLNHRWGKSNWGVSGKRQKTSTANWLKPLQWDKLALKSGERKKVFCASMADVFENNDDLIPWRNELFELIEKTPNLIWQLLTKRPENVIPFMPIHWIHHWPKNVWIGASVENQAMANLRIPDLLMLPAPVRFLSCEPLLGEVNLEHIETPSNSFNALNSTNLIYKNVIEWIICGGESGANARPMNPQWARSLYIQAHQNKIPFFFKQHGEWVGESHPAAKGLEGGDGRFVTLTEDKSDYYGQYIYKVGKKAAGGLLDRAEIKQFPDV